MATFDQRGQHVNTQYNAGRDINFAAVQTPADFVITLEQLKQELAQATTSGLLPEDTALDADYHLTKALQQARQPDPPKKTLLDHLTTVKALLDNVAAASGLVTAVVGAIEVVQKLFS
jgi:hypothetical protein